MFNRSQVPFYVQQGAGVSLITRPLAQVQAPPGSAYMEVGCGYGFGPDYAIRTKGWDGRGIDPAALSALGQDALKLPTELHYLRDNDEARDSMDVVMGSEEIEHVPSPAAFIRTLRATLKPGGMLIPTTPNGDDITLASPPGIIVPLLSPSLHLVIQTPQSLHRLLLEAGFVEAFIKVDSHSLVAFASDGKLALNQEPQPLQTALRQHLLSRAQALDPSTDLSLGFAGRALQEAVNDQDLATADAAWDLLVPVCWARFQLDLDSMTALPTALHECGLEEMALLVPLNLGGILYSGAIRLMPQGTARVALEPMFGLAAAAMRRALGALAMEDGQTEEIEWTARAEEALCAAAGNASGSVERLPFLPLPPSGGPARLLMLHQRAIGEWTNAGHDDDAQNFLILTNLDKATFADPNATGALSDIERDALFAMTRLNLYSGEARLAKARLSRVREARVPASSFWFAVLDGEMRALCFGSSAASVDPAAQRLGMQQFLLCHAAALDPIDDVTIGLVSRVVLDTVNTGDLQATDIAWALLVSACRLRYAIDLSTLASMPSGASAEELTHLAPPQLGSLLYARYIRRLVSGTPRAALEPQFALAGEVYSRVRRALEGRTSQNGQAADTEWAARAEGVICACFSLEPGSAERLANLPTPPSGRPNRQVMFYQRALGELVAAGHTEVARIVIRRTRLDQANVIDSSGTEVISELERDALFAMATLDMSSEPGGSIVAKARFARVRSASIPGSGIWFAALDGEIQSLCFAPGPAPTDTGGHSLVLRQFLNRNAHGLDTYGHVFIGLATRVVMDAINTGDLGAPDEAWAHLVPACREHYHLDTAAALPADAGAEALAKSAPSQLSSLLYARAIRRLLSGSTRADLEPWFTLAGDACAQLRRELEGRASQDSQAADLEWTCRAEAALCAAAANLPGTAFRLTTLTAHAPDRLRSIQLRALSEWVNAGHYDSARDFVRQNSLSQAGFTGPASTNLLKNLERDALLALALLNVQANDSGRPTREPIPARGRFVRVRSATLPGSTLWWAAIQGELQALDLMNAGIEATVLLKGITVTNPGLLLPPAITLRLHGDH